MSKLLFDKKPIVIDRVLAKLIGLNESIILQQIHYWLVINEERKINFKNNRYWTYNSIKVWHEECFDFFSYDTVKRSFKKLETMGILVVDNFNKDKRDRTKWYSIDYEVLESINNCNSANCPNGKNDKKVDNNNEKCIGAKCTNGKGQFESMEKGNLNQALPEITTEITTEIKSIYQSGNKNNNRGTEKEIDKMDKNDIENFRDLISKNIDFENLKFSNPDDSKLIENVYECLVSVFSSNQKTLYVGKQEKSIETVKSVFLDLKKEHILYVVESLKSVATKIKNIPAYIITSLFNAHKTIDISKKNKDIANSCKDHLPSQNKFNNFPQRKYDINSMEKQLLGIEE